MGFGNGPVIAASVMVAGAALMAGWGLTRLATTSDDGFIRALQGYHAPVETSAHTGQKSTGGGSAPQSSESGSGKPGSSGASQSPPPGRGGEHAPETSGASAGAKPEPKAKTYTIRPGDTLTMISGEAGVPIGILVATNKIQNPDLIYARATLLIPSL
ncbi:MULTISPECIES: LysM peptidoglycan-binding domain-containing protein [unclassified Streptomyces]|uniref:LysM peptidoglycan-binding domain-containing protein n=1 Tax=unclassified Streptomyces TaxID=2593676 RepID=UPI003658DBDE